MNLDNVIIFRLPKRLKIQIEEEAKRHRITISKLLRGIVITYLNG